MRHALFVAFHFPPEASSSGVLRTLKYVRYLPEHGWRVSVISVATSAYSVQDEGLLAQVPQGTRVVRTRYRNTKRDLAWRGRYPALLALPDVWVGWMPFALDAAAALVKEDPPEVVYSTSPHATAHVIARRIARRTALPWVSDFRDPWFEDPPEPGAPNGYLFRRIDRHLEARTVAESRAVVTSTGKLNELLRARYPDAAPRIVTIPNGFDEADFGGLPATTSAFPSRLTLVHAGSINAEFRDPRPLFASLARLIRGGELATGEVELRFVGPGPFAEAEALGKAIRAAGLADAVHCIARVPYEQSLRELATGDVLLLLQASDDTVGLVPAKLYEYLRAGKPTLALVRPGAVTEVLDETGGGVAVDPADAKALDAALRSLVRDWRSGTLAARAAAPRALAGFDRRSLAGRLGALFDGVAQTTPR